MVDEKPIGWPLAFCSSSAHHQLSVRQLKEMDIFQKHLFLLALIVAHHVATGGSFTKRAESGIHDFQTIRQALEARTSSMEKIAQKYLILPTQLRTKGFQSSHRNLLEAHSSWRCSSCDEDSLPINPYLSCPQPMYQAIIDGLWTYPRPEPVPRLSASPQPSADALSAAIPETEAVLEQERVTVVEASEVVAEAVPAEELVSNEVQGPEAAGPVTSPAPAPSPACSLEERLPPAAATAALPLQAVNLTVPQLPAASTPQTSISMLMLFVAGAGCSCLLGLAAMSLCKCISGYPCRLSGWLIGCASDLLAAGQPSQAADLLQGYLPRVAFLLGHTHVDTLAIKHMLGRALLRMDAASDQQLLRAQGLLQEVRTAYLPSGEDRALARVYEDQGLLAVRMGRLDRVEGALGLLKVALGIFADEAAADLCAGDRVDVEDLATVSTSLFGSDSTSLSTASSPAHRHLLGGVACRTSSTTDLLHPLRAMSPQTSPRLRLYGLLGDLSSPLAQQEDALRDLEDLLDAPCSPFVLRNLRHTPLLRRHPDEVLDREVARVCKEIGDAYGLLGAADEALGYYTRALHIGAALYGPACPDLDVVKQAISRQRASKGMQESPTTVLYDHCAEPAAMPIRFPDMVK